MAKQTTARLRKKDNELTIQHHETDSPLIPVAQIERLHSFRPDRVDWVFNQTQVEADHRRSEDKRVNTFIFVEHLIGQIFALIIGLTAISLQLLGVSTPR